MSRMSDPTTTFVAAVRRRAGLTRLAERAGVWLGLAAVVIAVVALIGRALPIPAWTAATILCLAGGSLVYRRWPTTTEAADRVDAAFGWPDLVGSAVRLLPGDDFTTAVGAAADAACRSRSPADVPVRRLGNRAWAGLGLTVAAAAVVVAGAGPVQPSALIDPAAVALGAADEPRPPAETARPVANPNNTGATDDGPRPEDPASTRPPDGGTADPHPVARGTGAADPAGGGANGGAASPYNPAAPIGAEPAGSDVASSSTNGDPSGGGRRDAFTSGDEASNGTAGSSARTVVPPWRAAGWASARDAAAAAVSDGAVPASRRGLVRDYFGLR